MKILFFLALLSPFLAPTAFSAPGVSLRPTPVFDLYSCRLILAAEDLGPAGSAEWTFPGSSGGSHGGEPLKFRQGEHELTVNADKQWMRVSWQRSGKKVAEGSLVVGPKDRPEFRVGNWLDPNTKDDQVFLNCDLQK